MRLMIVNEGNPENVLLFDGEELVGRGHFEVAEQYTRSTSKGVCVPVDFVMRTQPDPAPAPSPAPPSPPAPGPGPTQP